MLILEGADCTGKTTLAYKLIHELSSKGMQPIYSHLSVLNAYWDRYWAYIQHARRHLVQDRFHLSEVVYGEVVRHERKINLETYRLIDAHLRTLGAMTIVLVAEPTWFKDLVSSKLNTTARTELYNVSTICKVNNTYVDVVTERIYDIDYVYHLDEHREFPADSKLFIELVVTKYIERQMNLNEILRRKPNVL